MAFRRRRHPYRFACEPDRHLIPSLRHRKRTRKHAWICGDPQERQQTGPWQTYARQSIDLPIKPFVRRRMLGKIAAVSVDEKVGVDQDHLNASPSITARTSTILSILGIRGVPRSTDGVRYGFRCFGGAFMSRNPRRSASLITSLRLASRLGRMFSKLAATSSSMVNVVRMHQNINHLMS